MILRCLAILGWLGASGWALAQTDDHAAQIAARYEAMLQADPVDGIALDRLWKGAQERGETAALIQRHRAGSSAADALISGHLLKRAGRPEEAAAAYQEAARRDPLGPLPSLALAELASARGKPAEAAALYEAGLAKLPANDRRETDLLLKLGAARLAAGHPEQAADSWERLVARRPDDAALRRRLAQTYEANGLPERAAVHYEYLQAHAEPAERAAALRDLAPLRERQGDFDGARDALEKGLALTARDHWLHAGMQTALIRLHQRAGRVPELQARWEAEALRSPKDLGACENLKTLGREQGDAALERRWLEKIAALASGDREAAARLARLLADAGERERAAAIDDGLLKGRPKDLELLLARAELDVQMNRPQAAADRVEAAAAQAGGDEGVAAATLAFFLRHHLDAPAERRLRAEASARPAAEESALALARFFFSRRRIDEGRAVLNALVAATPAGAARAERLGRVADGYREANLPEDALRSWREAAALSPQSAAPLLAAAELLAGRPGAADLLRQAVELPPDGPGRAEIEQRLFQALNSGPAPPEPRRPGPPRPRVTAATFAEIQRLADDARTRPSPEAFLRLARWQSWAHAQRQAVASARRAVSLAPSSVPAREAVITLALENGEREEAARQIGEILPLDPERKAHWLKSLADLQIADGDFDRALGVYAELARLAPADVDALTDLATAQQRAGRWYDAQTTWERAYRLPGLTPQQRADIRRPLLAALERLGEFPRADEILQGAVDAAPTLPEKQELFHQLADFASRHERQADLARRYETRLAAQPQDYFLLTALASLRPPEDAYPLLARALYSSPDPAESLRQLVDAAEALGNLEDALAHQRQLVASSRPEDSKPAEKLARLQGTNLDDGAAAETWEAIVAKFPRDPAILGRAADFFQGAGQTPRARTVLRQLVALDPSDPKRAFQLGQIEEPAEARRAFEGVLAASEPEKPGDAPQAPPPPRVPLKIDDRTLRLAAIRALAESLPEAGRAAWIARWRDARPGNEPLWALSGAGAQPETSALLARWMAAQPGNEAVEQVFLEVSLRLGDSASLARWAWPGDPARAHPEAADRLLAALGQFLNEGGAPEPRLIAGLFPAKSPREVRWKVASLALAGRQWYAEAVALGESVLEQTTVNRADYAREIAGWNLLLGRVAEARDTLRRGIEGGGADSLTGAGNQYFGAVQEYWQLLPPPERAPFAARLLAAPPGPGGPAQTLLTRALLNGLLGDDAAACSALDGLIDLRMLEGGDNVGSSDARRWSYLGANAAQLQDWDLDALAIYLQRRALAEASAFQWREPECRLVLSGIRAGLALNEINGAPSPAEGSERLDEYLRTRPDREPASNLAAQLGVSARPAAAARVYQYLDLIEPASPDLANAYAAAGDHVALQRLLRRLLDASGRGGKRNAGMQPADLAAQLAGELERDHDLAGAERLWTRRWVAHPRTVLIGMDLAQFHERAGRPDQAAAVLRAVALVDAGTSSRLALAEIEAGRGNLPEAKRLLAEAASRKADPQCAEASARLIGLFLAEGDRQAALAAARDPAAALSAARAAQEKKQPVARELFALAARRASDPVVRFEAQRGLLNTAGAADLPGEVRRLKRLAGENPKRWNAFEDARFTQARALGLDPWLEAELKADWDAGRATAGLKLVELFLATGQDERLAETVKGLGITGESWEPTAFTAQGILVQAGRADLAAPLAEKLSRRLPQNKEYALAWMRALWKSGQLPQADAVAEGLCASAVARGDIVEQVGRAFLDLGDKGRALAYYRRAGAKASAETHLALAGLELSAGEAGAARRDLRAAYLQSETADLAPLVDWLAASGQWQQTNGVPGGDFPLPVRRRGELALLIFDWLAKEGKVAQARQLALAHPELLAVAPELGGRLREGATAGERPAVAAALERAIAQSSPPAPRLERELAALCLERATDAPAEAPLLLARAHELCPEDFQIARRLAERCLADRRPARAVEALKAFTSDDALPAEKEAARAILGRKR